MGGLLWLALLVVFVLGGVVGWAVHREHDCEYIERRARWIAQHELAPLPARTDDVIDAEIVYATSDRLDRLEVTR